jgi:hypothetical protein
MYILYIYYNIVGADEATLKTTRQTLKKDRLELSSTRGTKAVYPQV